MRSYTKYDFFKKFFLVLFKSVLYIVKLAGWFFWVILHNSKRILKTPIIFGTVLIGSYFIVWSFFSAVLVLLVLILPFILIYTFRKKISGIIPFIILTLIIFLSANYFGGSCTKIINGFEIVNCILSRMDVIPTTQLYIAIIISGTKLLIFVIPLTLTFFYFSYREQKSLAISLNGFWNSKMLAFIICSLFSVILGKHISLVLTTNNISIAQFEDYHSQIYSWLIFLILTISSGLSVVKDQMNSFNLNYQLMKNINKMENELMLSYFTFTKKQLAACYSPLCRTADSIYQLLFLATEKNMVQDYKNNFEKWSEVVSLIADEPIRIEYGNKEKYKLVLDMKKDTKEFENLYKSILKNHITLISRNIQNNRIEEAKEALQLLKSLKLNPVDLKTYYYGTTLNELVFLAFKQDFINLFLEEFIDLVNSEAPQDSGLILSLYNRMIMHSIEKNDVKLLSKVIYLMTINHLESKKNHKKENVISNNLSEIPLPMVRLNNEDTTQLQAKIYSIYLAAIKCIELSQYSQIGFILKFLVTNFDGKLLREVYQKLEEGLVVQKSDANIYYKTFAHLSIGIDLNKKTMDYCFKKLSILLYFQQRYVVQVQAVLDKDIKVQPYIPVFKVVSNTPYINYLYQKILKSKDKYGLLCLNDQKFLGTIERSILKK